MRWSRRKCKPLVSYQGRGLEFSTNIEGGGLVILSSLKFELQKLEKASELAKILSDYIYHMCELYSDFDKGTPEFKKYVQEQDNAIRLLTVFRATLVAFDRDPDSQRRHLDYIIEGLQKHSDLVHLVEDETSSFKAQQIGYSLEATREIQTQGENLQRRRINEIMALYSGLRRSEIGISLNTTDLIRLGNYFYYTKDYQQADKIYNDILERDPNNAVAWNNKCLALVELDNREEAFKCWQKAISIDPNNTDSYRRSFEIAEWKKRFEHMLKDEGGDYVQFDEEALENYAAVSERNLDFDTAIKIYSKLIDTRVKRGFSRGTDVAYWFLSRGKLKVKKQELNAALDDFRSAIRADVQIKNSMRVLGEEPEFNSIKSDILQILD